MAREPADGRSIVIDAIDDLTDGLLGQPCQRLRQRGSQEIAPQPAFGTISHRRPDGAPRGVDDRAADQTSRQNRRLSTTTDWRQVDR